MPIYSQAAGQAPNLLRLSFVERIRTGSLKSAPADLRYAARDNALPDSKIACRAFRVALKV